ncbi:hypothetical protein GCM10022271_13170 [Corallibacter vietnamensis]|uniref:Lacal_2735 family protein n=1 Tax=Corallibacter vietnamensis TaxID=904130 RepID=A0ABP7H3Q8_9FLAO
MNNVSKIKKREFKLQKRYKRLVEQAYNLRQTDCAESDISEFNAIKLLNKINKLKYLYRERKSETA